MKVQTDKAHTAVIYDEYQDFAENRAERRKKGERGKMRLAATLWNKSNRKVFSL